jgi:general secretion pathway protein E
MAGRPLRTAFYPHRSAQGRFTRVADVMSASYAARFNILPVELSADTLVVATADPYVTEWEAEIAKISRRVVPRDRQPARHRAVHHAVLQPGQVDQEANKPRQRPGLRNNFEQLVELGKSNKQVDANDQHIINIVDWLWQYAFEQRASDIHLEPKRDWRRSASASTACCTRSTRCRPW